jgi:hypothetical protein
MFQEIRLEGLLLPKATLVRMFEDRKMDVLPSHRKNHTIAVFLESSRSVIV